MNIVLISCTHRGLYLSRTLLSSILYNKKSRELLNITVIGDQITRHGLKICTENISRSDININLLDLESVSLYDTDTVQLDKGGKSRYKCAYVKLELAFILMQYNHSIVLDVDTVFLEDVSVFWNDFRGYLPADLIDKATIYIARASESSTFQGWDIKKKHWIPPSRLNTGVLFLNLFKLRELNLTLANFLALNDEPAGLADNDILETWAYYNINRFGILPCKWNKILGSECPDHGKSNGIIHGPNGHFEKPRFRHLPNNIQNIINFYENQSHILCPLNS